MIRPDSVKLKCTFCGHEWIAPIDDLKAAPVVTYRGEGDGKMVRRRIKCPNCEKDVITKVPKAWLDDA